MKKRILSMILALSMLSYLLMGCGAKTEKPATTNKGATEVTKEAENSVAEESTSTKQEVLEFYHGYFHDESAWAPAKVMRDIYDEFAATHADGSVIFKPIAVENRTEIMNNKVAGGAFPDIIDLAGESMSLAAIEQKLVYNMKPYIEEQGLQTAVGINYTQNDVDGAIYTVHDQLMTLGFWYNEAILTSAGAVLPATWTSWDDFGSAMAAVRTYGKADGIYAYGAGQGSIRCFNALLATTKAGVDMLTGSLTEEIINSEEFANTFKKIATLDQTNGSANTSETANDFSADFSAGVSSVFFNGVWAAGGFSSDSNLQPAVFPGNVALSSAGGGITIANGMSDAKTELALEFMKYMTSIEVQTKIFLEVNANPCNANLNIQALAEESGDATVMLLAKACSQANSSTTIVTTLDTVWGGDIQTAITNKLIECSVNGVNIDAKLAELQNELMALIG